MRGELRADINVTPLIDVCLVLLIVFMLVTPLLTVPVELPEGTLLSPFSPEAPRAKITIAAGPPARVTVDEDPQSLSEPALETLLAALYAQGPNREIVIRADRRLPYAEVKRVFRAVQAAGFRSVGLAARGREAGRSPGSGER